jgi:hypothetical protein
LGDEAEWEGGIRAALRKMINAHKDPPFNPSLWKTLADQFLYHIVVYLVKKIICPRRKVTFVIRLSFQGQNQDFDLKCCMEGRNLKNNITGSYPQPDTWYCLQDGELAGSRVVWTYPRNC